MVFVLHSTCHYFADDLTKSLFWKPVNTNLTSLILPRDHQTELSWDLRTDNSVVGRINSPPHQSLKRKWLLSSIRRHAAGLIESRKAWICSKEATFPSPDNLSDHNSRWISFPKLNQAEAQRTVSTWGSFITLPLSSAWDLITGCDDVQIKLLCKLQTVMVQITVRSVWREVDVIEIRPPAGFKDNLKLQLVTSQTKYLISKTICDITFNILYNHKVNICDSLITFLKGILF